MAGFLGIQIVRDSENNTVTMTQTGLIDRILAAVDMEDCNLKYTAAEKDSLCKDETGVPCCENWDYRSIVGMLLYLVGSTRPNITYAVHQCARFSHNPKHSHEVGVKHIVRYRKGTRDMEIIIKPDSKNVCINMYANADTSWLYIMDDNQDPISTKSRSGILLTFGNVPILCSSRLQTEIALSTLEAEYIALSQGMRDLVSARILLTELGKRINYKLVIVSHVSKVWEENTGTQNLVNSKGPLITFQTIHIAIKYHWFRSLIGPQIEILCIDTNE